MNDYRLCDEPGCAYRGKHIENCPFCFGWGFYTSRSKKIPVNAASAGTVKVDKIRPCSECGGRADMEKAK